MKNISFALTQSQILNQTKTVTRRLGWATLGPGIILQPVIKGMGLKKGEKVTKLGCPIEVVSVRRERLDSITIEDIKKEGFEGYSIDEFVEFFAKSHAGCKPDTIVTRIEFKYTLANTKEN